MRVATVMLVLALSCGGCAVDPPSEPVTFQAWQKSLEDYVWNQANGDPDVLRDMSWDDVHRGFAIISDPLPDRSTDAIGLLVDHRKIEDENYFIFLFALVRQRVPGGIRAVALSVKSGKFRWFVGDEDPLAFARYRTFSGGLGFPAPVDSFKASFEHGRVGITHEASGAEWYVAITSSTQPAGARP